MKNKLEELHNMRERCGIKFQKSFRCKDAEKNIHLLDIDTFFKKFKKKLDGMGYTASDDFTFDVIRFKYDYAERHHVGKFYSWKYFYSSTFVIEDELIDYLSRNNFILKKTNNEKIKKEEKQPKTKSEKNPLNNVAKLIKEGKTNQEIVESLITRRQSYYERIEIAKEKLQISKENNDERLINGYSGAIRSYKQKIKELDYCIEVYNELVEKAK